jgi:hypothetical protein
MKKLTQYINEALGDTLPREFIKIWKGENPTIDPEVINNVQYFSKEVMNVHKGKLPTEKEFENLCQWIIDNTSFSIEDCGVITDRMVETFIDVYVISDNFFKWDPTTKKDMRQVKAWDIRNGKLDNELILAFFFYMDHFADNDKVFGDDEEQYTYRDLINNMECFNKAFKKYHLNEKTWPSYEKGIQMLKKHMS